MKIWETVVGPTRVERDQIISMLHFGQIGASSCSNDFLSLSTMSFAASFPVMRIILERF
jgi:hypothetical protein